MSNSEKLSIFDESRDEFKPYGLTCELWTPHLMRRPDRHNEIELNFCSEGAITYLFGYNKVKVPAKRIAVFWGLIPHQIIHFESSAPYYVCTIPFAQFLEWKLPSYYVERLLQGEILYETSRKSSGFDEYLLKNWIRDINGKEDLILLEMHGRLARMADRVIPSDERESYDLHSSEISPVESIAIFIAQNYHKDIKTSEIGNKVRLHPDYANSIFKKAFGTTISGYIIEERVAHAQRKLVSTDMAVTEIAYECGFNSISRFNSAFLKMNRCTPREFRKKFGR